MNNPDVQNSLAHYWGHTVTNISEPQWVLAQETAKTDIANQRVTRGLFKRLDGVIAWPEEITNPRLSVGADRAAWQHKGVQ